jgi:hypothetical protein
MSQLVEPVEVTWKRAAAIWWNFTWRQIGVFVTIGILNVSLNAWISSLDDGTFKDIVALCSGLGLFILFFLVSFVIIHSILEVNYRDFRILLVKKELTPEELAAAQTEDTARKQMEHHHNIT